MNKNKPALLGVLALCLAAPASAALYRCGNVFQDRPCDSQAQQEVLRPGGGASPQGAASRRAASQPAAPASAAPASSPASSAAAATPDPASAARVVASATPAPARKGTRSPACPNLQDQHAAIEGRLRAATRSETLRMYERQLREVERNLDDGNCR